MVQVLGMNAYSYCMFEIINCSITYYENVCYPNILLFNHYSLHYLVSWFFYRKYKIATSKLPLKMAEPLSTSSNNLFVGTVDRYKGVHIKSVQTPCDVSSFKSKLEGKFYLQYF